MTFAEKVKKVRATLNLTQEQLAREFDVSFATVNRWKSGTYQPSRMGQRVFEDFCKRTKHLKGVTYEK